MMNINNMDRKNNTQKLMKNLRVISKQMIIKNMGLLLILNKQKLLIEHFVIEVNILMFLKYIIIMMMY